MATPNMSGPPTRSEILPSVLRSSGFSSTIVQRAEEYQRLGRVTLVNEVADETGRSLKAYVKGSRRGAYEVDVEISRLPDGDIVIDGDCSCPMAFECKHVVAAVLEWSRSTSDMAAVPNATPKRAGPTAPSASPVPVAALSATLQQWLTDLGNDLERAGDPSPQARKRLLYVLDQSPGGVLGVTAMSQELDKVGTPRGSPQSIDPNNAWMTNPAKYLRADDLAILRRLARGGFARDSATHRFVLADAPGAHMLAEIAATGRAHWGSADGKLLRMGEPREGQGAWRIGEDGAQRFTFVVAQAPAAIAVALRPVHYIDTETGQAGALRSGMAEVVACRLLAAPPVAPEEAPAAAEAIARLMPPDIMPAPVDVAPPIESWPAPVPIARLSTRAKPRWQYSGYHYKQGMAADAPVPALHLTFDYDGTRFQPQDRRTEARRFDGTLVHRVHRDPYGEGQHIELLADLGFTSFPQDWSAGGWPEAKPEWLWLGPAAPIQTYADFMLDAVPQLEAKGWRIEIDPEFPIKLAHIDDDRIDLRFGAEADEASGIDWFDVSADVSIDGQRFEMLPLLTGLLRRLPAGREMETLADLEGAGGGEPARFSVMLPDGRLLPLEATRIVPILRAMLALWGPAELAAGARLHAAQAGDIADLRERLEGVASVVSAPRLDALCNELAAFRDRPPTALPAWFGGELRPYQQTGVDWLQMLARAGFGGVLADDMGLGKTVQLLGHLSVEKAAGRLDAPALVVAPTSVLANWRAEAERFAPELKLLVHQGLDRARNALDTGGVDLVITSYPLLARDRALLLDRRWSVAALDEAQTIRNPKANSSLAAFALDARQRIALSGTPVENHLGDVWSLMQYLNPGLLGDASAFRAHYRTPIEKHGDAEARKRLARRLKPFLLRRTKAEVASELPAKTEIREVVSLTPGQRQLYEATRLVMQKKVREALDGRGLAQSAIIVLDALLKLRQACCDPRLVKSAQAIKVTGSAKLDRLLELLTELREEGRSALIFSQFTSMLDLIRVEVDARGWRYSWLTGSTRDRATPVNEFQRGDTDLFLISLKAGGVGLNLTRADTVILYDPWWNPAVEAQAIDRAHRIGQAQKIFVHRLIAEDTIEEKMLALQERKRGFADALWDGDAKGFAGLTDVEVRALFE